MNWLRFVVAFTLLKMAAAAALATWLLINR
jgi:hypothetical protein